jgi:hypothetical protein
MNVCAEAVSDLTDEFSLASFIQLILTLDPEQAPAEFRNGSHDRLVTE